MTLSTQKIADSLELLTLHSFEAFCEDVTSMFSSPAECNADHAGQGALNHLQKEFKKLASVNQVQASGTLNGVFQLLLDQEGLFILSGVFVMLPEKRIHETIRNGTLKDANYINDAIKEVGNLLAGSWDRVLREELSGHKHLDQIGTFVGSLLEDTKKSIGFEGDQSCHYVICKMKVDGFPEFKCAAVFPDRLFETGTEFQPSQNSDMAADAEPQTESDSADAAVEPQTNAPEEEESSVASAEPALNEVITDKTAAVSFEPTSTELNPGSIAKAISPMTHETDGSFIDATAAALTASFLKLSVQQIMNPAVLWVDPEDTVENVLRQMQQQNIGYVLVGSDGQIEGLVSRSDIAAAVSPYIRSVFAHWRRPLDDATLQIRIKWCMSRPVHTIRPEASLFTLMEIMVQRSVRGLPVVDANGQALGFITVYDVFGALLGNAGVCLTGRPRQFPPLVQ